MSVSPTLELQGIKFFTDKEDCLSAFKNQSWKIKAISFLQSYKTFAGEVLDRIYLIFSRASAKIEPYTNVNDRTLTKDKLVVCIHGLNHHPMAFKRILDEMKKRDNFNEADIFIPHVLERGNGKLDDMIKPIFEEIKKWAQKEGGKELVLVGISNGGRIARALEVEVAKSKDLKNIKKLRFVSIVGACKGSSLVNIANRLGLSCFISKNISEEMPKDSQRNQQLNNEWQEMQSKRPEREYAFIASPHDWHVPNYSSSLMRTGSAKALYGIIAGYGHISAPNGAAQAIAELVFRKNILD